MRVNATLQGAEQRGLAVITAADDDGKAFRDAHARDGAAAGELEGLGKRLRGFEGRGLVGAKWTVAIPRSAREDRTVADESDELAGFQLGAQGFLVAQECHVILEGLRIGGVEAIVPQAVVGDVRQVIGQQVCGLAAQNPAAFGGEADE